MAPSDAPILIVGVVADTHIPDRASELHPKLIPALEAAKVGLILHAGDISTPSVLEELGRVAPVKAVRGNRDWSFGNSLPLVLHLELAGVPVALMHGHGGWVNYIKNKGRYIFEGYQFERYRKMMVKLAADARVIIFGHTHRIENVKMGGRMIFNPGSANSGYKDDILPSIGFLHFFADGEVQGEIMNLTGYRNCKGKWEAAEFS